VREIEAQEGRAFEIDIEGRHDVLLLGPVETARFVSDFEVAWVRFSHENPRVPDDVVVINGHKIEFEGRELATDLHG
jgi:hypothetical protein